MTLTVPVVATPVFLATAAGHPVEYEPCLPPDAVWRIDGQYYAGAAAYHQLTGSAPAQAIAQPATHHLVGYVDSVDATTGQVRVATRFGGTPGPWEPIATYGYPCGAHPSMPVVALAPPVATWPPVYVPWYSPGLVYPTTPDPVPPTERAQPKSEWCCGGTCLRSQCDYHREPQ